MCASTRLRKVNRRSISSSSCLDKSERTEPSLAQVDGIDALVDRGNGSAKLGDRHASERGQNRNRHGKVLGTVGMQKYVVR